MTCTLEHEGRRCKQTLYMDGLCRFHWHLAVALTSGRAPRIDPYYHRKILDGLVEPNWPIHDAQHRANLIQEEEKGDGRPTDAYVIPGG